MKLISYTRVGRVGFGARVDVGVIDLTGKLRPDVNTLKQVIEADLLGAAAAYLIDRRTDCADSEITLLPLIPDPGKILCVGLNCETHRAETKRQPAGSPGMTSNRSIIWWSSSKSCPTGIRRSCARSIGC